MATDMIDVQAAKKSKRYYTKHGLSTLKKAVRALRGQTNLKKNNKMMILECPMSRKDLQRVTECVSDIGQPPIDCRALPARRHHVMQKVKIAGQRMLYLSVNDNNQPRSSFA
jgi:hypothetical protein